MAKRKTFVTTIRLSAEDKKRLDAVAKQEETTASNAIRLLIRKAAAK